MQNLQSQYDQMVSYVGDYHCFVEGFSRWRLVKLMRTSPRQYKELNNNFWKMSWRFDPLSQRNQSVAKLVVPAMATQEERDNPFFAVATSEYAIDALSDCLKQKFSSFDFGKLKRIHDSKRADLEHFSLPRILGVVFAGSALVLNSIPQIVVESTFKIRYDSFVKAVFWVTAGLAVLLFVSGLWDWKKYSRAKLAHRRVGEILEYTVIKND